MSTPFCRFSLAGSFSYGRNTPAAIAVFDVIPVGGLGNSSILTIRGGGRGGPDGGPDAMCRGTYPGGGRRGGPDGGGPRGGGPGGGGPEDVNRGSHQIVSTKFTS